MKLLHLLLLCVVFFASNSTLFGQTSKATLDKNTSYDKTAIKKKLTHKANLEKEMLEKSGNSTATAKLSSASVPKKKNSPKSKVKQFTPPSNQTAEAKVRAGLCSKLNHLNSLPQSDEIREEIKRYEASLQKLNKQ